jgi:hypothetical protein
LLCMQLHSLSEDIARDMRRRAGGDYRLPLETYFSACLNAARSCFFTLARTGGAQFKNISSQWRTNALDQKARSQFNSMCNLRDRDVHFGEIDAATLPKMVEATNSSYLHQHYNAALFGPQPMAEHTNPDGATVRATALQGTFGLYVEIDGHLTEATIACAAFIAQLRSLLAAAEAANVSNTAASD